MKNYLLISLLLLFIGCGGGGGGAAAGGDTPNNQIPNTTVLINGQVIDGYIQNAKVCADLNYNQNCDNNEPSTLSDPLGNYSLTSVDTTNRFIPILAIGGLDNATNEPYNDTLIRIVDATSNTQNQIISPLGDLVAIAFLGTSIWLAQISKNRSMTSVIDKAPISQSAVPAEKSAEQPTTPVPAEKPAEAGK